MNNQCKTTHYIGCDCYEEAQQKTIAELREAIATWPEMQHGANCNLRIFNDPRMKCDCGVDSANKYRAHARRVAGLEEP